MSTADPIAKLKLRTIRIPNSASTTNLQVSDTHKINCPKGKRKLIDRMTLQNNISKMRIGCESSIFFTGLELSLRLVHLLFPRCKFSSQINTSTKRVKIAER